MIFISLLVENCLYYDAIQDWRKTGSNQADINRFENIPQKVAKIYPATL